MGDREWTGLARDLNMSQMDALDGFIRGLPVQQGFPTIASRAYHDDTAHGEADYDALYGYDRQAVARMQQSLAHLLRKIGAQPGGFCVDVGCGTGVLGEALGRTAQFDGVVFSDPSLEFLRICREKLAREKLPCREIFVAMGGEDIRRFPQNVFSLVAVRYTLHHIYDWRQFLKETRRILSPGGFLLLEEPFAEGFLLQALLIHFDRVNPRSQHYQGHSEQWYIDYLRNCVSFYLLSSPEKAEKEDKHLFQAHEIMTEAQNLGYHFQFFPNAGFEAFSESGIKQDRFLDSLLHNCRVNLRFPPEMVARLEAEFQTLSDYLDPIQRERQCLFSRGLFALRKME
jgi:ubiquinone/menaquinone biosynthesis C-methylase UbiE